MRENGLHLRESGKDILANNFLSYLSECFFDTHAPSGGVYFDDNIRNLNLAFQSEKLFCSRPGNAPKC